MRVIQYKFYATLTNIQRFKTENLTFSVNCETEAKKKEEKKENLVENVKLCAERHLSECQAHKKAVLC